MKNEKQAGQLAVTDPDMGLIDSIYARHSVRGYLEKEVPQDVMNRIFEIAQQAPSNCNVQPWKVYVASGELKDRLRRQMVEATAGGLTPNPDYPYRGDFQDEYRTRQVECAVALYSKMGIRIKNKRKNSLSWRRSAFEGCFKGNRANRAINATK